jgi:hypothetical protein
MVSFNEQGSLGKRAKMSSTIYNYATIKELAKKAGKRVTDLIALSRNHDPFYVGTPADQINAKWFAELWQRFGYGSSGIHIRRVHYQIISQTNPILLPSGVPYTNTEQNWAFLGSASEKARYLGLVDCSCFVDRRNPEAIIYPIVNTQPTISVDDSESWVLHSMPLFPDIPSYSLDDYQGVQRYAVELWCEKSTMNEVLAPVSQQYQANLQTGVGELSITKTLELFERIRLTERPTRIGYISDFDPGGQSMPVAIARKLEFFLRSRNGGNHDVKLFPICLTLDQIRQYQLPRTPIKETEKRKDGFEQRFGVGAVELDALEALYPGTLEQIITKWIDRYYDHELGNRVNRAREGLEEDLYQIREQVIAQHEREIERLRRKHQALRQEFDRKIKLHSNKLTALLAKLSDELQSNTSDLGAYPIPEAAHADETVEALFDSSREYFEQLDAYKKFQGRNAIQKDDDEDEQAD